jgi:hypothetical protein
LDEEIKSKIANKLKWMRRFVTGEGQRISESIDSRSLLALAV